MVANVTALLLKWVLPVTIGVLFSWWLGGALVALAWPTFFAFPVGLIGSFIVVCFLLEIGEWLSEMIP